MFQPIFKQCCFFSGFWMVDNLDDRGRECFSSLCGALTLFQSHSSALVNRMFSRSCISLHTTPLYSDPLQSRNFGFFASTCIIFNIHANEASNAKNSSVLKGRRKPTVKIHEKSTTMSTSSSTTKKKAAVAWSGIQNIFFDTFFSSSSFAPSSFCRTVFYLIRRVRRSNDENKRCLFYISFISMEARPP